MNKDIFLAIIKATYKDLDEKQIEIIFSNMFDHIYDDTKNLVASVALGVTTIEEINQGDTIWVMFETYYMDSSTPEFEISHCVDHGFAKLINSKNYIKCLVDNNPKYGEIHGYYLGCGLNGNMVKTNRIIVVKRTSVINL